MHDEGHAELSLFLDGTVAELDSFPSVPFVRPYVGLLITTDRTSFLSTNEVASIFF